MHTVTWLMALHLIFTYGPKAVDMANGVQQFVQHERAGHASPALRFPQPHQSPRKKAKS